MAYQGSGFGGMPREMHKATCAECKKECEAPVKPRDDRPVYCKECFAKRRNGGPHKASFGGHHQMNRNPSDKMFGQTFQDRGASSLSVSTLTASSAPEFPQRRKGHKSGKKSKKSSRRS